MEPRRMELVINSQLFRQSQRFALAVVVRVEKLSKKSHPTRQSAARCVACLLTIRHFTELKDTLQA